MENFLTSKSTGSKFEIKVNLPYGSKGGANYSEVKVAGQWRHTNWFVSNEGGVTALVLFDMDDQQCKLEGVATISNKEFNAWVENKVSARMAEKKREENYRLGQEFGY